MLNEIEMNRSIYSHRLVKTMKYSNKADKKKQIKQ